MLPWQIIGANLLSPMVLAFFLGLFAVIVKSDLKLPKGLYTGLSMYLLLALGLKGGVSLSLTAFHSFWLPGLTVMSLGILLPLLAYNIAHYIGHISEFDSAALAAHYGSVSVVTFIASQVFVESLGHTAEGFMTALVVILEVPGIVVALMIAELYRRQKKQQSNHAPLIDCFKEIIFGKSILLLLGGLVIGYLSGKPGLEKIAPFFIDPFLGVLVLFMLDMGLVAGEKIEGLRSINVFLIAFSFFIPILNGFLGACFGYWVGLSIGGATVLATMAASASYIAAPAAVRMSLPEANPAYYLTSAIVLTFPFNIALGIPLYYQMTLWVFGQ
jgi:hypothetical protein